MLLAKIEGNKVYFWKLVSFFGESGVNLPPTYPLEGISGGGSDPLEPPIQHLWMSFFV